MLRYFDARDQGVHFMPAAALEQTLFDLPSADQEGFRRTIGRGFLGEGASLAIGTMPPGQRSPQHDSSGEHLLLGLEGEITWMAEGFEAIVMGPGDLVFIGANQSYHYLNQAAVTARFVDVIGRVSVWPHSASYAGDDGQSFVVGHED